MEKLNEEQKQIFGNKVEEFKAMGMHSVQAIGSAQAVFLDYVGNWKWVQ